MARCGGRAAGLPAKPCTLLEVLLVAESTSAAGKTGCN